MQDLKVHNIETRAVAKAMTDRGETFKAIQQATNVPDSTLKRWRSTWAGLNPEELRDNELIIAGRAQAITHQYLDAVEQSDPETVLKHGMTVNAIRGTAIDKVLAHGPAQSTTPHVTIIIESRDTTPTINATVQHIE